MHRNVVGTFDKSGDFGWIIRITHRRCFYAYAFNRLVVDTTQAGPGRAIAVTNSFAWRPGAWVWYDIFPRVGLNVFGGYLFTRPELTFADDESISSRRVNAGTAILSVGVAYWVF